MGINVSFATITKQKKSYFLFTHHPTSTQISYPLRVIKSKRHNKKYMLYMYICDIYLLGPENNIQNTVSIMLNDISICFVV